LIAKWIFLIFGNFLVLVVPFFNENSHEKVIKHLIFPAFGNILVLVVAFSE